MVFRDTSDFMFIERDHIIDLDGKFFLVRGNEREGRFGLDDQPKFWVKRAVDLDTGRTHILKLVFHEEFIARIGTHRFRCTRSEEKEGQVLQLVRGDLRFMQGRTARDSRDNLVRIIDFIPGADLFSFLTSIDLPHEEYFHTEFPRVLARALECFGGISRLHEAGLCHGDIRNDHILIEKETGRFRWIDFDLTQNFSDFDLWSLSNILHCVLGKGLVTFRDAVRSRPGLQSELGEDDASVVFPHRVMNLRKIYPYVPKKLNDVLMRFSQGTLVFFDTIEQLLGELADCVSTLGRPQGDA
ncbi:MAG: hypothetical protein ACYTHN_04610 [Planctomycetota bacterium]